MQKRAGAAGILGLAKRDVWELCSWSPDIPSTSPRREKFTSIGDAAEELCRRIRDEFENAPPALQLETSGGVFAFVAWSRETGTLWKSTMARLTAGTEPAAFPLADAKQLAERVRRLVEGELRGWVSGISSIEQTYQVSNPRDSVLHYLQHDDELLALVMANRGYTTPEQLSADAGPGWADGIHPASVPAQVWQALSKRCARFYELHGLMPDQWCKDQHDVVDEFEGALIDLDVLNSHRTRLGLSTDDLLDALVYPGDERENLARGQLALRHIPAIAKALDLPPEQLLRSDAKATRIPLPKAEDLALWLSRMQLVDVQVTDATPQLSRCETVLRIMCLTRFVERKKWTGRVPANLRVCAEELEQNDLVACARMQTHFVRDTPTMEWRPTVTSVLDVVPRWDVLTQNGRLEPPADDSASPEWLRRFNSQDFTGAEMMRYSDRSQELRVPEGERGPNDDFIVQSRAGIEVFNRNPHRAHAASIRMEALARLIEEHPLEPWVLKSSSSGALMVQEAAFEATAKCELTNVGGRPGFDHQRFYLLCATYERR